mmetsp:Transcript_6113/g.14546  ORF Transcript_6113/g.14546 Transcript_6113/m.14546 type:complete len:522 (+) Transcript_6113:161-1726(+)
MFGLSEPGLGALPASPGASSPAQRATIELHLVCGSLVCIACCCLGYLLVVLEPVLKPLVFAIFLAYLLSPAVDCLTQAWSPQALLLRCSGGVPAHKPERVHDDEEEEQGYRGGEEADSLISPMRSPSGAASLTSGALTESTRSLTSSLGLSGRLRGSPSLVPGTVALPHSLAVLAVLSCTAVLIAVFFNLVVNSVASLEEKWDKYKAQALHLITLARSAFGPGTLVSKALRSVHQALGGPVELSAVPAQWLARYIQELPITSCLMAFASTLLSGLETTAIVLLYSVFLMMGNAHTQHKGRRASEGFVAAEAAGGSSGGEEGEGEGGTSLAEKIDTQVRRYIVLKSALSLLVAVLSGGTLALLRVDLAFLFGAVAFFANFVPNVGSVVSTLLPLPIVLLDPALSWMGGTLAIMIPLCIHVLVGSVIEPKVFGMGLALHPVVVLFTVLLWAKLWGVGGMIVSVPLTAVLRIVLKEVNHPYTKQAVSILEGRWMPQVPPGVLGSRRRSNSNPHFSALDSVLNAL